MTHDFGRGATGALRAGLSHGAYCVGCCWALMSLLVIVGLMNLVWMAVLAVIFLAEKNWRYGAVLTRAAGVAVICLGVAVAAVPALLPQISGGPG
jgi:predicted metal-binding membrane protein